eukprot:9504951-Prorocentrum_lima.AAC.1
MGGMPGRKPGWRHRGLLRTLRGPRGRRLDCGTSCGCCRCWLPLAVGCPPAAFRSQSRHDVRLG